MAEMVETLVLLQISGTSPDSGTNGNLLRLGMTLSRDPYCLGYINGMFDALCQLWEVRPSDRKLIVGTAYMKMFRSLLSPLPDRHRASMISSEAFPRSLTVADDAAFRRGHFDGCSELVRYTTTKEQRDIPTRLHEHLKRMAAQTLSRTEISEAAA